MGGGEGCEFDRLRAPDVDSIDREKGDELRSRRRAAVMYLIASALFLIAGVAGLVGGTETSIASIAFIVLSVAFAILALNAWTSSTKDSADS
jgi:putative Ca2+/H+ antiporter (TMEM165/GDT1 family)